MKKVSFAVLGLGNRGWVYASHALQFPQDMEITAVADIDPARLQHAAKHLNLAKEQLFDSAETLLQQSKLADVMVVSTQDRQHRDHAIRAMELGYDLLLEKPIAADPRDIKAISEVANRLGRRVIVCHVLRYTPFYRAVKKLLQDGIVGRIMNIEAAEHVGYYHIAHSFVRGNWHKESDSSPMILAKCCHDMDLLLWLTEKRCRRVSSFGSLSFFKAENRPEGAPKRCTDGCPQEDNCPFHAPKFYLSRIPGWPSNVLHPEPNEENIMEALRTTNYGRCVFDMDNDVVDHQVLNMEFEDGILASFTMSGFNNIQTRTLRIAGTEGEIWGNFHEKQLHWQCYNEQMHTVDLSGANTKGHGGGDTGIVLDMIRLYRGDDFDTSSITTLDRSTESHYLAFAAEESRLKGGQLIDLDAYISSL